MAETVPAQLAVDATVTHDPATRSLLVKVFGVGATFWRRGYAALERDAYRERAVYAHARGRREIGRGVAERDGWLRFKVDDQVYRELTAKPGLHAIATVDQQADRILGVKFLHRAA